MNSKFYLYAAFSGLMVWNAQAQQLPVFNQYIYNPYLYNPARTGQNDYASLNINFKRQWANIANSPITGVLSGEAPIKSSRLGVGGLLYSDRTHIINRLGGMATCAYHVPFSKDYKHGLSAGISLGVLNQRFAFAEATVANPNDAELFGQNATGTAFDFSAGLDYQLRGLHFGVSVLQGLNNSLRYIVNNSDGGIRYTNSRHWLISGSYALALGAKREIGLQPTILARAVSGIPLQIEGLLLADWRKAVYLGFGYRSSNNASSTAAIMTTAGIDIKQQFFVGYSFEFGVDPQMNASLGTQHEFMIRFRLGRNKADDAATQEMKSMMEEMKQQNMLLERQMSETRSRIDSLNQQQINTQNELNLVKEQQGKTTQELAKLQQELGAQNAINQKQQEQLDKHERELEDIRRQLNSKSPEFKKLGEVEFQVGNSTLDKLNQSRLDALLPSFQNTNNTVYIYGHASVDGDRSVNQKLSLDRAVIVRKYLIMKGIAGDRIEIVPFGAGNTINGNDKTVNPNDRRAEIFVK